MARAPKPSDAPDLVSGVTRNVQQVPRDVGLDAKVEAIGAAGEIVNRLRDAQIEVEVAAADAAVTRELERLADEVDADADWETAPQRYGERARVILQTRGEGLRGERAQQAWRVRSLQHENRFAIDARKRARQRGAEQVRAGLVRLRDEAELVAGDPALPEERRREAVANLAGVLQRQVESGFVDEDWAAEFTSRFGEAALARRRDALEGMVYQRIESAPEALLAELKDPASPFREFEPGRRGQFVRMAEGEVRRVQTEAAQTTIADALTEISRTGEIVPETDPRFADAWRLMGDDARLRYAGQAARAQAVHRAAAMLGDTAGLSLAEIEARADLAGGDGEGQARSARMALGVIRQDPAAYVLQTDPLVERTRQQMVDAVRQAQAAPDDPQARASAARARGVYVMRMAEAQDALGLNRGQIRIFRAESLERWAASIRALPVEQQQATLNRLETSIARLYGLDTEDHRQNQVLAVMADEHRRAFYGQPGAPAAASMPGVEAQGHESETQRRAVEGADYETVRDQVRRSIRAGNVEDALVLIERLTPQEQRQLEQELVGERLIPADLRSRPQ